VSEENVLQFKANPIGDDRVVKVPVYRIIYTGMHPVAGPIPKLSKEMLCDSPLEYNSQYGALELMLAKEIKVQDQKGAAMIGMPLPQITILSATFLRNEEAPLEMYRKRAEALAKHTGRTVEDILEEIYEKGPGLLNRPINVTVVPASPEASAAEAQASQPSSSILTEGN
jgi:hypothetical protein